MGIASLTRVGHFCKDVGQQLLSYVMRLYEQHLLSGFIFNCRFESEDGSVLTHGNCSVTGQLLCYLTVQGRRI